MRIKATRLLLLVCMALLLIGCTGSAALLRDLLPAASFHAPSPTSAEQTPLEPLPVLPAALPSAGVSLAIEPPGNAAIEKYGLLELDLQTSLHPINPYNPAELELKVRFTAPSGKEVDSAAFWYQGYDLHTRQPSEAPVWKVRFTPDETGEWTAVAYTSNPGVRSQPFTFHIIDSKLPGFVRIHPTNPRYFALDNGDFFFPIGVNMAWWKEGSDPVGQYGRWLDDFSNNGGNTIRIWMASWSFGLEWKDSGLGNYDGRQYEAWLLDQLFRLAHERGIKIILVLINHGPFSTYANSEWADNPYNTALGGPIASPDQFTSNPTARSLFEQRLSYIINRWGYSPDLLAWEWWNEVNLTAITDKALIPWLKQMTTYLRQRDVYHHLTTISYAGSGSSPVWQMSQIDIIQRHEYSSQVGTSEHDLAARARRDLQSFAKNLPTKPILMGEFGYSASNYGDDIEPTGIHLHNGLWATTFSGYAGTGMYWWWDNYIDVHNLWYHFNGLRQFLGGEDLSQYQPMSLLDIADQNQQPGAVVGLGLRGAKTLVWLRSNGYTVQASMAAQDGKPVSSSYVPPFLEGLHLTLNDMADGKYTVRWYDPQMARWLDEVTLTAQNNLLTVPIPAFRYDLAAKIVQNP